MRRKFFQSLPLAGVLGSGACKVPEGSSETFSRLPKRVIRGRLFPAKASVESKKEAEGTQSATDVLPLTTGRHKDYEPRRSKIEGGSGGGCPILVFGITKRLYEEDEHV